MVVHHGFALALQWLSISKFEPTEGERKTEQEPQLPHYIPQHSFTHLFPSTTMVVHHGFAPALQWLSITKFRNPLKENSRQSRNPNFPNAIHDHRNLLLHRPRNNTSGGPLAQGNYDRALHLETSLSPEFYLSKSCKK